MRVPDPSGYVSPIAAPSGCVSPIAGDPSGCVSPIAGSIPGSRVSPIAG